MQQVKSGDTVKVHYHGRLTSGETFDSSSGRDPLEFKVGSGSVISGFDDGVTGMTVGEKKTIQIPFMEAYGPRQEEMVVEFPIDQFPPTITPQVGMPLTMSTASGDPVEVVIVAVQETTVLLDANHPLAGQDLIFDLELVEIAGGSPLIILPE
jgi:peptidylprolyl isomerase